MINIKSVTKKYGDKTVFDNFNLCIKENEITVILGESGSGKTTLLNMIAGLTPFSGEISGAEKVSMVFQRDRLVPHLTVKENILLVNENADAASLLRETDLAGAEDLYPAALSAGMARRVAIARAFACPAKLVLMDEPLVNLDLSLKYSLFDKIKDLRNKCGKTVILVTHDVKEAATLADRVIVISRGKTVADLNEFDEELLTTIILKSSQDNTKTRSGKNLQNNE